MLLKCRCSYQSVWYRISKLESNKTMMLRTSSLTLFTMLLLSLAACTSRGEPPASGEQPTPTAPANPTLPSGDGQGAAVYVDTMDLLALESFPVQMRAIVKGNLPDACTTITSASSQRDDNIFRITFVTTRPADAVCAQMLTPFEQTVELDVAGLKAGTYTVVAGDVTETFELKVDNDMK